MVAVDLYEALGHGGDGPYNQKGGDVENAFHVG